MKWIGQHIHDQISRFRDDVYLEDIAVGTIVSGGNLGLDSNDKIVKAVVSSGDITSVQIASDSGTVTAASGDVELTIAGGTGISTSVSGDTITIAETAEKKSKADIDALTGVTGTNLGTFTGAIISDSGDIKGALQELETKAEVVAATGTSGIVELATTAETNTGSDAARVVTPDGLNDWTGGSGAVTKLGTIATGVWSGTKIADTKTNSSGKRFGDTIKILPTDFMLNEDVTSEALTFKDGTTSGVAVANSSSEMIAFVTIPEGMKATALDIFSTHTKSVKVYELEVDASFNFNTATANETGNANTQITIDPAINATDVNYLAIIYVSTATGNRIYGGQLTVAAI